MSVVAREALLTDTRITGACTTFKPVFTSMFDSGVPVKATTYFSAATEQVSTCCCFELAHGCMLADVIAAMLAEKLPELIASRATSS